MSTLANISCPNCGGFMYYENDEYENFIVCAHCAREYNLDMLPCRMIPPGINSTHDK